MIQQSTCSTKRRGSLSFAARFQYEERKMYKFVYHIFPSIPPLSLKLTRFEQSEKQSRRACGFWMKWRNVLRSWQRKTARGDDVWWVSNENRCMSFPLYLWATVRKLLSDSVVCVLIMFESLQNWIIPTIVIFNGKKECGVVVKLTHNIIDDFLIIRCTLTGIIMSCYDSRISQPRRDW